MSTDTTETGLESLIVKTLTGLAGDGVTPLDAIRKLLDDVGRHGAARRYLIQHSAVSSTPAPGLRIN